MSETQALSPEIVQLFESVKSQARQYTNLFEQLDFDRADFQRQALELEFLRNTITNYFEETKSQIRKGIEDLHQKINNEFSILESETDKTNRVYKDLKDVQEVRDNLLSIFNNIKKEAVEWKNLFESYKINSITEIDLVVNNIKSTFEEQILEVSEVLETRFQSKLSTIETKLFSVDNFVRDYRDKGSNSSLATKNALDNFKMYLTNTVTNIEESSRLVRQQIYEVNADLSDKMIMLNAKIENMNDAVSSLQRGSVYTYQNTNSTKENVNNDSYQAIQETVPDYFPSNNKELDKFKKEVEDQFTGLYQQIINLKTEINNKDKKNTLRFSLLLIILLVMATTFFIFVGFK
jgi:hypothetical protein